MNEENADTTETADQAIKAIVDAANVVDQTDQAGKVLGDDKSMRAAIGALQAQTRALSEALEKVADVIRSQGYDL